MDAFATEYAIVEIEKLKEHEEVSREHSERVKNEIVSDGVLKKSIAVDRNTNVVLDGHHRLRALKEMGYTKIPAVLVDYRSPRIQVISWKNGKKISKDMIVGAARAGDKLPPKTSRHVVKLDGSLEHISSIEKEVNVPLGELCGTMKIAENALDLIGNTPLVKINKLAGPDDATVLAKLERQNIGGSTKDRIAKCMIEEAERRGLLSKGKIILEPTSGNTGIGLAIVAAVKGYKALFVMSEGASEERRKILKAFGAEIILTPREKGTDGAIDRAYTMASDEPGKYFMPDQFNNWCNPKAHYDGTGIEIWNQTAGKVDMVVAAMGTTGTVVGTGRRLKEMKPSVKVVGVEPNLGHRIQGMKNLKEAYMPGVYVASALDEKVNINDEDAFEAARRMAREEGLLVGMSAGAVMHVALQKAKELGAGKVIVAVLPDGGERYLSTELFK